MGHRDVLRRASVMQGDGARSSGRTHGVGERGRQVEWTRQDRPGWKQKTGAGDSGGPGGEWTRKGRNPAAAGG